MTARTRGMLFACALVVGVPATATRAATLHVDAAVGSDAADGLSWSSPTATIGAALALAQGTPEADDVLVAEGRYPEFLTVPPDTMLRGGWASGGATRDPRVHVSAIDGENVRPLIVLGPGTDASGIEGFTLRRGRSGRGLTAPSILLERTSAAFRDNVIERCGGEGSVLTRQEGSTLIERSVFRDNRAAAGGVVTSFDAVSDVAPLMVDSAIIRTEWPVQDNSALGGLVFLAGFARGEQSRPILERCLLEDATVTGASSGMTVTVAGVFMIQTLRRYLFRDVIIRRCGNAGIHADGGTTLGMRLVNCLIVGQEYGVHHPGTRASEVEVQLTEYDNCTVSATRFDAWYYLTLSTLEIVVEARRCIFEGQFAVQMPDSFIEFHLTDCLVTDPAVLSGATVSNVVVADPAFIAGRVSGQYLSQVACGDPLDSPALDGGPPDAAGAGLPSPYTTCTREAPDAGAVDWGFHAGPYGFSVFPDADMSADLRIMRGTSAASLSEVARTGSLGWSDASGTLSDSSLPLLFYRVDNAFQAILARADEPRDAVILDWAR